MARKRKSSNGLGPLFWIMSAVVLAVIVVGFIWLGPKLSAGDHAGADANRPVVYESVSRKDKPFPDVEPWTGEIGDKRGTVRQGMTRAELIAQFGRPEVTNTDFNRTTAGVDELEYYDEATSAGIMQAMGGRRLTVKIELSTDKVVWFMPPQDPNELIEQTQQPQQP